MFLTLKTEFRYDIAVMPSIVMVVVRRLFSTSVWGMLTQTSYNLTGL